ncbi:amino acid adenylation domain-containing protein [Pendulispora rubella]|uniref:Amino acid adenylation domain-containing protein n=1 Tax=Pendulispora rubella TaxID=2741070 RepID=A0ABZ2LFV0_9BACT
MPDDDAGATRSHDMSSAKRALLARWKRGGAEATKVDIPRATRTENGAPLSSMQQRLWYLDQLVPGSPAYNVPFFARFEGRLDVPALQRALTEIVRRHETLRTIFPTAGGRAKPILTAPFEVQIAFEDLRGVPPAERDARTSQALQSESRQLLPLESGPLFAARLLRLADDEHLCLFTIHHIVSDGWSLGVFNRELAALYAAYAAGKPSPLPELPIQYADFATWQQQRLAEGACKPDLDFWRRELTGLSPLALPTDRPRPPVQTFRGARVEFALPEALTPAIQSACLREDVTPYMFFLAAFTTLLARYSGQDDVAVGSPIANRGRVETEGLIGFFSNTIVLRTDLSNDPSFRELLGRIRVRSLAAFQHQELPFEWLVNELEIKRDTSRNPIFQVMMVLQNTITQTPIEGLVSTFGEIPSGTSKFDIWLQWMQIGTRWQATFEYATDLFDEATIARMSKHLVKVLESVTESPELTLSAIPLLDAEERLDVLTRFNDTAKDYGPARPLHEHIEAQVDRTPHAVAVSFEGRTLTYAELDARANQLAHLLVDAGVRPDTLVGVYAERSLNLVVALLGVLKSGAAYVPLDPSYPDGRVEHMIRDTAVPVLLTDRGLPERLTARLSDVATRTVKLDDGSELAGYPTRRPAVAMGMEHLAYVIFTSGSTGLPKGAMNTHRGICNRLLWMQDAYGLGAGDRVLQKTPFSFDVSVWEFFWPLMTGARLVVARPEGHKDPAYIAETITSEGITTIHFVPSMLQLMLDHPGFARCTSLTRVVCSGEALPAEFRDRFFTKLPAAEMHNLYGPTEAAVDVTFWQCRKEDTSPTVPIGKPIANTQIYILDVHGQPAPIGVPGELYIGGTNVGRGYLNRPELDAERFVRDPFADTPGRKMYRTGDRARWLPSGDVDFMGRLDSQVKLRGLRIELEEIEHALRMHDLVANAAVLVRPTQDASGEERQQLAAYVVPTRDTREGMAASDDHVSQWEHVFDRAYDAPDAELDPALNLAGWTSSYDGKPIPKDEMLEWTVHTVERILETKPRRVLEIGCGTGLLLQRIAPHCESFLGTDTSETALRYLRAHTADLGNVTLEKRSAERFDGLEPGSFDTVVLNSVAQYFPSADYLARVIAGCLTLVEDGGTIFLGDIRDHARLETFHASVEMANAAPDATAAQIRQRIDRRTFQDNELALSPLFFLELEKVFPRIAGVRILLKRGRADNELTRFRYDVRLHVGRPPRASSENAVTLDWATDVQSLGRLVERLPGHERSPIHVRRVPNRRLTTAARRLKALRRAPDGEPLGAIVDGARGGDDGESPESFFALAERLPYDIDVLWTGFDDPEYFDVVLTPHGGAGAASVVPSCVLAALGHENTAGIPRNNDPLHAKLARKLVPELRSYLGDKLPEFMVPHAFMILDRLPVSPNGKLDRDALPPPVHIVAEVAEEDVPRTAAERELATIWTQVLGLERVGIESSFFELGGDSVLSIQVVARANEAGLRVTPQDIVRHQSIRALAAAMRDGGTAKEPVVPSRPIPELSPALLERIAARAGAPIEDAYPLSAYQREQLRNRLSNPPVGLYVQNMTTQLRAPGSIDLDLVEAAWQAVAERHASFRSSLHWQDLPEPFQVVHPPAPLRVERHDVSALTAAERTETIQRWVQELRQEGFVLERPGHVRIALFQTAPDDVVMVWLYHYMFSDGWSASFVLGDFVTLYDAMLRRAPSGLPPANPYRRYIEYQRSLDLTATESFWRRTMLSFDGVTPLVESLGGRRLPPAQAGAYLRKDRSISAEATTSLRALAKRARVTLNNLVQAAWCLILARYTGRSHVSFGSMMSGRSASLLDYERMVGIFTNVLPMNVPIAGEQRLIDWVQEIPRIQADLTAHHHASLPDIRRWSRRTEDTSLFDSSLVFINWPMSADVGLGDQGPRQRTSADFIDGQTQTEHPIRFVCIALRPTLDLQFFHYEFELPDHVILPLVASTCDLLERLSGLAASRVSDVLASIRNTY